MHPTPAAKQSQLCSNSTARRGYRDCLPTPIHSSKSFTTCLVFLPVATYQPIPSHLSCACAALRSQSQSQSQSQSHSFPPSLIPRPFFRPSPAELGDSARKKLPSPSVDRCRPHYYIYLGTPQVARVRQLPGRARLPNSHPRLPFFDSARLDWSTPTTTINAHLRSLRRPDRPSSCAPAIPACLRVVVIVKLESDRRPGTPARRTNIGANAAQPGEHSGVIGPGRRLPHNGPRLANRSWRRHN